MTSLDLSKTNRTAPPTPSKWDVIPIHTSDRATFKFCRRQWAWSSPSRENLIPKSSVHGIREALWYGTGIHNAIEKYYSPLREDPVVAFTTWFQLQWEGGLVHYTEVKEYADRNPEPMDIAEGVPQTYRVDGLRDILPDPDEEKFMNYLDLGQGMMRFYKEYAEREDNFSVIALEHDFSVPILDPDGNPLYWIDNREMPEGWERNFRDENAYGPLMKMTSVDGHTGKQLVKQVHARGRMDMIVQDAESGQYGITDHKTTSRLDDDYFRHLDLDEQCTSYLTLGEIEAKTYDLEYKDAGLEYIIYQALLKGYPKPPTITSRGLPSIDRNNETTTAELFEKCIRENGLEPIFNVDEKMQNYYTWLLELGDRRFIDRTPVYRNKMQRRNAMIRLYYEAVDMLSDPRLYPNPTKNYGCLNCMFRAPCIAAEDGSDWKAIIEDGYMPNWDR